MADTNFIDLPGTGAIQPGDQLVIVRGGAAYRFTGSVPTIQGLGNLLSLSATSARGSGGVYFTFSDPSGRKGYIGYGSTVDDGLYLTNDLAPIIFQAVGAVRPAPDNAIALGTASYRWSVLYAGTGTINTSDEREKHWRGELTPAHLRAARRIIAEFGLYQWLDAVAEKGEDGARIHVGPRAQRVMQIMIGEGLEEPFADGVPHFRHAFLCYDRWPATPATAEVRGDDGEVVTPAQPARPAGDRFGLRIDQLTLMLIAAQEARIAALEAA